jgi:hypothetical protein
LRLPPAAAAALEAELSDGIPGSPEQLEDALDDDEAAEILEAMLGLAPAVEATEPGRKKRKGAAKVSHATYATHTCIWGCVEVATGCRAGLRA